MASWTSLGPGGRSGRESWGVLSTCRGEHRKEESGVWGRLYDAGIARPVEDGGFYAAGSHLQCRWYVLYVGEGV